MNLLKFIWANIPFVGLVAGIIYIVASVRSCQSKTTQINELEAYITVADRRVMALQKKTDSLSNVVKSKNDILAKAEELYRQQVEKREVQTIETIRYVQVATRAQKVSEVGRIARFDTIHNRNRTGVGTAYDAGIVGDSVSYSEPENDNIVIGLKQLEQLTKEAQNGPNLIQYRAAMIATISVKVDSIMQKLRAEKHFLGFGRKKAEDEAAKEILRILQENL